MGHDQSARNFQDRQRDSEKIENEASEKHEDDENAEDIHRSLYGGAVALAFAEIGRKGEKQRYAAKRIHDRK